MTEAYTLTGPQLMEVCVQFSAIMGWIDAPPSADWRRMCEGYGGPEGFLTALTSAMCQGVARAAEENNIEALIERRD
jgi:hypothetical protein